jgi:hypothetical protein
MRSRRQEPYLDSCHNIREATLIQELSVDLGALDILNLQEWQRKGKLIQSRELILLRHWFDFAKTPSPLVVP